MNKNQLLKDISIVEAVDNDEGFKIMAQSIIEQMK
jgi:hypothetical protein